MIWNYTDDDYHFLDSFLYVATLWLSHDSDTYVYGTLIDQRLQRDYL